MVEIGRTDGSRNAEAAQGSVRVLSISRQHLRPPWAQSGQTRQRSAR